MEKNNLRIAATAQGIMAMSLVCTHLGCITKASDTGFDCPCHGSRFNERGEVTGGPAPRGLRFYEISHAADGNLIVNMKKEVPEGTYFQA